VSTTNNEWKFQQAFGDSKSSNEEAVEGTTEKYFLTFILK